MNQLRASRTVDGEWQRHARDGGRASSKDMTRWWRCQPAMHQVVMDGSKLKTAALGSGGFMTYRMRGPVQPCRPHKSEKGWANPGFLMFLSGATAQLLPISEE